MRLHFGSVPVAGGTAEEEALNQFLAQHRVISIDRHLVGSAWAICVTYVPGGATTVTDAGTTKKPMGAVDYRDVLSPEDFAVFSGLRTLRKEIAQREGVPPYAVLTNEQLATVVRDRIDTVARFGEIAGVGGARAQKYGALFVEALSRDLKTSGAANGQATSL